MNIVYAIDPNGKGPFSTEDSKALRAVDRILWREGLGDAQWLDANLQDREALQCLLRPFPPEGMVAYPVSTFVNAPRNEGPQCVEKVA
jgi:putative SOS response-associated peptidase YedK